MKDLIIFGTAELAELAYYYFTHDSDYEVVAFTVDEEFYDKDFSFGDLAKRGDHLRAALTDCLIGNVDNNEFRELFDAMSDLADLPKPVEHGLTTASS